MCYLSAQVQQDRLMRCLDTCIFEDPGMLEQNISDIQNQGQRTFESRAYRQRLELPVIVRTPTGWVSPQRKRCKQSKNFSGVSEAEKAENRNGLINQGCFSIKLSNGCQNRFFVNFAGCERWFIRDCATVISRLRIKRSWVRIPPGSPREKHWKVLLFFMFQGFQRFGNIWQNDRIVHVRDSLTLKNTG